jgi:hypothetical protein
VRWGLGESCNRLFFKAFMSACSVQAFCLPLRFLLADRKAGGPPHLKRPRARTSF